MNFLIAGSLLAVVSAAVIWFMARREGDALDVSGEPIYIEPVEDDLMVSEKFGLVGKPDYVLEQNGELIPVERKSRNVYYFSKTTAHDIISFYSGDILCSARISPGPPGLMKRMQCFARFE
jgi:hypothetical protein